MPLPAKSLEYFKEKYNLLLLGNLRVYSIPIIGRVYGYERCTPKLLIVDGFQCTSTSWKDLLLQFVQYLLCNFKKNKEELFSFHVEWSKANIFSDKEFQKNCLKIEENLYLSHNFTGAHYVWFIQDLLAFFAVNPKDFQFLIHVPSMNEPEEVKQNFKLFVVENFKTYLKGQNKSEKAISIIINNIEKINKVLVKLNIGTNDFFLIDDLKVYLVVKGKAIKFLRDYGLLNEEQIDVANKYILHLYNFLKSY